MVDTNNDDAFAAAFAQISAEDSKQPVAKPTVASVASADNQSVVEPKEPIVEQQTEGADQGTDFELPKKTPAELAADAEAAIAAAQTPEEKTAAEALKVDAEAARIAAEAAAAKAKQPEPTPAWMDKFADVLKTALPQPPQPKPQPQVQEQPVMTDEEAAFLTKYDQEFPDIARAEFIRRRVEYGQLVNYIFKEVSATLGPLAQMVGTVAERVHLGDIQTAVPDYNAVREEVVTWVDKQPAYLKAAYQNVVSNGTQEEVVDLINRWRADTGRTLPVQNTQVDDKKKEPTAAAKAAAAALAPVSSKRTGAVKATPDNFDDAFAEFANQG